MAKSRDPPHYRVYLLAVWQEKTELPDRTAPWRFRLEDPHSGCRVGFATVEELMSALQKVGSGDEAAIN